MCFGELNEHLTANISVTYVTGETIKQMLNRLSTLIDYSKLNSKSKLVLSETGVNRVYTIANYRPALAQFTLPMIVASDSKFWSYLVTIRDDYSSFYTYDTGTGVVNNLSDSIATAVGAGIGATIYY